MIINYTNEIKESINKKFNNIEAILFGENQFSKLDNSNLLVYDNFNDLYIVYYEKTNNNLITKKWLKEHNLTELELREIALNNANNEEIGIDLMRECIFRTLSGSKEIFRFGKTNLKELPIQNELYMCSNLSKFGSSIMLNNDALTLISEQFQSDIIMLPSSIYEIIMLPYKENSNINDLKETVKYVNSTNVEPDIQLSNNVYIYSRNNNEVTIID